MSKDVVLITIANNEVNNELVQTMCGYGFGHIITHEELKLALIAKAIYQGRKKDE